MAKSNVEVLNLVRGAAGTEYKDLIPVATQDNIQSIGNALEKYDLFYNEMIPTLFGKIGMQIVEDANLNNMLARFRDGRMLYGKDVEEIFVMESDSYDFHGDDPNNPGHAWADGNPFERFDAQSGVVWHRENRQQAYPISVSEERIKMAFHSADGLARYTSAVLRAPINRMNMDEYALFRNILVDWNAAGHFPIWTVPAPDSEENARLFLKHIIAASLKIQYNSNNYNAARVFTRTDLSNQVLLIRSDILPTINVDVLASQYNLGSANFDMEVLPLDDFDEMDDTTGGVLMDRQFFRIFDTLRKQREQENGRGLYTTYYHHAWSILSASPFRNAIRFAFAEPFPQWTKGSIAPPVTPIPPTA